MHIRLAALLAATALVTVTPALAKNISVLTPYQASVATAEMIDVFKKAAEAKGHSVTVIDTAGDMGALASRIEDTVAAKADAMVLVSVNPSQVQDQVNKAAAANIPVIAIDGAAGPGVAVNVTSDNFELGTQLSKFLFAQMGGKGNIVKFFHSAHPGVHQRELALDEALKSAPDIKVIADHFVKVPGPMDDARVAMEAILKAQGDTINGVWAAWDEPAMGALLAIQADKPNAKILIAGIDGNPQAVEQIKACTNIVGTVKQDFATMSKTAEAELETIFGGGKASKDNVSIPSILITRETLGVKC